MALLQNNIAKWRITGRLKIIPVRPFGEIDEDIIWQYATKQNKYAANLQSFTLR